MADAELDQVARNRSEPPVHDAAADHAEQAPARLHAARRVRGSQRWLAAGAVAATVAAVGVGAALFANGSGPAHPAARAGSHAGSGVVPIPSGYRLISYHGLELAVPRAVPLTHFTCGWTGSAVLALDPELVVPCPAIPVHRTAPPPAVSVEIAPSSVQHYRLRYRGVVVHGMVAEVGYGTLGKDRGKGGVLIVPGEGVAISVHAASRRAVNTVLHSARAARIDRFGCVDRVRALTPTGNAASNVLVPAGAKSTAECEYARMPGSSGFWLVGSGRVVPAELHGLVRLLDSLPDAHRPGPPSTFPVPTSQLIFRYGSGTRRVLELTLAEDPMPITDGRHYVQDRNDRVADLLPSI